MLSARHPFHLAEIIANFTDRPVEMADDQELVKDQRALVSYSLLVFAFKMVSISRASQRSEGLGVLLPPGFCIQNGEYTNINWVTKKVGCIGMEAIGSTSRHISSDI